MKFDLESKIKPKAKNSVPHCERYLRTATELEAVIILLQAIREEVDLPKHIVCRIEQQLAALFEVKNYLVPEIGVGKLSTAMSEVNHANTVYLAIRNQLRKGSTH